MLEASSGLRHDCGMQNSKISRLFKFFTHDWGQRNSKIIALLNGLIIIGLLLTLVFNSRLYFPDVLPTGHTAVDAELRHIRYSLDLGAGTDMQRLFPEGDFFTYVLYGLTQVNVGLQTVPGSDRHQAALREARWAWAELGEPHARGAFERASHLSPQYGVFYTGWRNYLLAGILLLQSEAERDQAELAIYQEQAAQIALALTAAELPFLESYPNAVWPGDTFPAVVSLHAYATLVDDRYEAVVATWLDEVQTYQTQTGTLLPHFVNAQTGAVVQPQRATSTVMLVRFLYELDQQFAEQTYRTLRAQHVAKVWGFPAALEYPKGTVGLGDVDSGPLIAGVSLSATTVLLGTARQLGDHDLATALWHSGELLGMPVKINGMRQYWFGVLPVGDAFLTWSKTTRPWLQPELQTEYADLMPAGWRFPIHAVTVAGFLLFLAVIQTLKRTSRWIQRQQVFTKEHSV